MSTSRILAVALAALPLQALALSACDWSDPGRDPFRGSVPLAIARMSDLPPTTRVSLAVASMRKPDDRAMIWRDEITSTTGRLWLAPDLRDMAFGSKGRTCDVTRGGWSIGHAEPARVWRVGGVCLVIPEVCGNPSWTNCGPAPAYIDGMRVSRVPEPGTLALAVAAIGAGAVARKRIARKAGRA